MELCLTRFNSSVTAQYTELQWTDGCVQRATKCGAVQIEAFHATVVVKIQGYTVKGKLN